nr:MAG: DNA pilot protein [Microvirus sp.]
MSALALWSGYYGQKKQNIASAQQAQRQMDFQRDMSNTAVQRRMADLRKAGLNPILAGGKEASSPAGQQAPVGNRAQAAVTSALNAAQLAKLTMETKILKPVAEKAKIPGDIMQGVNDIWDSWYDRNNKFPMFDGIIDSIRNTMDSNPIHVPNSKSYNAPNVTAGTVNTGLRSGKSYKSRTRKQIYQNPHSRRNRR